VIRDRTTKRIKGVGVDLLSQVGDNEIRITFSDGEVFVLRFITRVVECEDEVDHRSTTGETWSGEIVEAHGLTPERARFHRPGARVDFKMADVDAVSDELSSRLLWSAS
jgi:hypothetical protein